MDMNGFDPLSAHLNELEADNPLSYHAPLHSFCIHSFIHMDHANERPLNTSGETTFLVLE